jgi:hypothetical protein
MMEIKEIEFNSDGKCVGLKGSFKKSKYFSIVTDKIIYWAEFELDYCGG